MNAQRYHDGNEIQVGDIVRWAGNKGTVVFVVDSRSYSPSFPEGEWSYLGGGFMLQVEGVGLVHEREADEDLELVARASAT